MDMNWESAWDHDAGRAKAWVGATVAGIFFSLMAAFVLVVSSGVRQGDQRRLERSAQDDATWRCNALRPASARADCPLQRAPLAALGGTSGTR